MEIIADETEGHPLISRAIAAHWQACVRERTTPSAPDSAQLAEHEGRRYVILRSAGRIRRVYRVRAYDGILRQLKRWPAGLVEPQAAAASDLYSHLFGNGRR